MTNLGVNFAQMREEFNEDRYRPRYHFSPPRAQLKDPCGPIFWQGNYHLFYGTNPYGAYDDTSRAHWGHAVSKDLIYWQDWPMALAPTPGGPDSRGCFSGGSIIWNDTPTLFYYGNPDGICIATSVDGLHTWQKHPQNPLIPHYPNENPRVFDPCVWKEGDVWYCLSGGRVGRGSSDGSRDTAFVFRSYDFLKWDYLGQFYDPGQENDCAVPDFFSLGDKYMLLFSSHKRGVQYYLGEYVPGRFEPEFHGRMNFGPFGLDSGNLCAAFTLLDDNNRRIMFGWVAEGRTEKTQRKIGWSGIMCLPRVLSISSEGSLNVEPVTEMSLLRRRSVQMANISLSSEISIPLDDIKGDSIEIEAEFDVGDTVELGMKILCSPGDEEYTTVLYDRENSSVSISVSHASLSDEMVGKSTQQDKIVPSDKESIRLKIYVDRSIIEVFDGGGLALTKRVYPSRDDSLGVKVFARGGTSVVKRLELWEMASIW